MKINNVFQNVLYGSVLAIVGYSAYDSVKEDIKADKDFINNSSNEIRQKDFKRYKRIIDNINSKNVVDNFQLWNNELKSMRDSLYIDSIAKTNYAKGAQMVRDSIKNAAKTIK